MITNGSLKLSNCAASTRNTTRSAPPSVQSIDWLDFRYSLASPSNDSLALGGSSRFHRMASNSTASRHRATRAPGSRVIETARRRSKRFRAEDVASSSSFTTLESGISSSAPLRADVEVVEIGRRRAILDAALQDDVVLAPALDEGRDDTRAHHRFERAADRLQRDAELRGARPIDRALICGLRSL